MAGKANRYVYMTALLHWLGLFVNIVLILSVTHLLSGIYNNTVTQNSIIYYICIIFSCAVLKMTTSFIAVKTSANAGENIKILVRSEIYKKLLRLGGGYNTHVSTAEMVQLYGEGVEQLDIYFGRYWPQLFYSLLAPLTLFAVSAFFSLKTALVLLACVPFKSTKE